MCEHSQRAITAIFYCFKRTLPNILRSFTSALVLRFIENLLAMLKQTEGYIGHEIKKVLLMCSIYNIYTGFRPTACIINFFFVCVYAGQLLWSGVTSYVGAVGMSTNNSKWGRFFFRRAVGGTLQVSHALCTQKKISILINDHAFYKWIIINIHIYKTV